MKTKKIRCGLVGLGRRAFDDHLPALLPPVQPLELVAVQDACANREPLVSEFATGRGCKVPKFYTDLDQMLRQESLDFVVVATPHHTHLGIARQLLEAGVPFLKEKPFALNLKEANELVGLIERHQGHMRLCVQRHFHPLYVYGRKALRHIGHLRHFNAWYQLNANSYDEGWRANPAASGGGCVIDMGYHLIDLLCWYFGVPSSVYSAVAPNKIELPISNAITTVEETTVTMLEYEDGLVGHLLLSLCEPDKSEGLRVDGGHGYIQLDRANLKRFDRAGTLIESLTREPAWPSAVTDVLFDVVASLNDPDVVREECRAGLEIMSVIEAIYLSMRCRRPVNPRDLTNGGAL